MTTYTAQQQTDECHWKSKVTLAKKQYQNALQPQKNQTVYLLMITNRQ